MKNNKVNEIKISYRNNLNLSESPTIIGTESAADLLFETWDKDTIALCESFKVILLNRANKVKGLYLLSVGGINGTLVDIRLLFATILKSLSVSIILAHNHPSGNLHPSGADLNLTDSITKAAKLFGISVLDHIIITPNGEYYSFSENGKL